MTTSTQTREEWIPPPPRAPGGVGAVIGGGSGGCNGSGSGRGLSLHALDDHTGSRTTWIKHRP